MFPPLAMRQFRTNFCYCDGTAFGSFQAMANLKIYLITMMLFSIGFALVRAAMLDRIRRHLGLRLYLSFAAVILAGFTLRIPGLFVGFSGLITLFGTRDRLKAICQLTALLVLIPNIIYQVHVGSHYFGNISMADSLTFGALILGVTCFYRTKNLRIGPQELIVILLMLVFSVFLSRSFSDFTLIRNIFIVLLEFALPYYLFSRFINNEEEFMQVVALLACAATISSIFAIYEARFHWSVMEEIWKNNTSGDFVAQEIKIRGGYLRTPVSFRESTSFAVFQMIGILATVASRRFFRSNFYWVLFLVLSSIGLLAAQSRGAGIGLVAGLFGMMLIRRQYGKVIIVSLLGLLGVGALFMSAPPPKYASIAGGKSHGQTSDSDYRQTLLRRGLEEGMKNPVFGDDARHISARLEDLRQGEGIIDPVNTYLWIFLYSGLFGLGSFIILIFWIFCQVWPNKNSLAVIGYREFQIFVAGALCAELVAILFTAFWERNPYWLMMILAGSKIVFNNRPASIKINDDLGSVKNIYFTDPNIENSRFS